MAALLRLNLGAGDTSKPGYINVDKYGTPDVVCDLEEFPWPWEDGSVEDVIMANVLEHLGQQPSIFLRIMQELYRICANGALIHVTVPHPRHNSFINDPTHVRAITPEGLELFSRQKNLEWRKAGLPNTALALQLGVDFESVKVVYFLAEPWKSRHESNTLPMEELKNAVNQFNNVVDQMYIVLKVIKAA